MRCWESTGLQCVEGTAECDAPAQMTKTLLLPLLQVLQLCWDGTVAVVCTLGGGPPALLVGVLADRLLVARGSATGGSRPDMAQRFVGLLQPLLMGWATLVAQGLLPGEASVLGLH